jgi:hypothetical protein
MKKNKKGIFFTIISALLVGFFVLMVSPPAHKSYVDYKTVEGYSLEFAHDFYQSLKYEIVPSIMKESAYNALNNISREYKYLPSKDQFENYFKGLYWNKTGFEIDNHFSNDLNMTSVLEQIEQYVTDYYPPEYELLFEKDYDNADIKIFQNNITGAYGVGVNSTIWIYLNTPFATWNQTVNFSVIVPIVGIEDPTYANNTENKYHNYFNYSALDIVRFINGTRGLDPAVIQKIYTPVQMYCSLNKSWNYTCFEEHVNRSAYIKYEYAPSFLDRMKQKLGPPYKNGECCGIESILNPNDAEGGINMEEISYYSEVSPGDGDNKRMIYVDHCFFGGECEDDDGNPYLPSDEYTLLTCLQTSFPYIKIDDTRIGFYNLSDCIEHS